MRSLNQRLRGIHWHDAKHTQRSHLWSTFLLSSVDATAAAHIKLQPAEVARQACLAGRAPCSAQWHGLIASWQRWVTVLTRQRSSWFSCDRAASSCRDNTLAGPGYAETLKLVSLSHGGGGVAKAPRTRGFSCGAETKLVHCLRLRRRQLPSAQSCPACIGGRHPSSMLTV